jgi:hypothetical protein
MNTKISIVNKNINNQIKVKQIGKRMTKRDYDGKFSSLLCMHKGSRCLFPKFLFQQILSGYRPKLSLVQPLAFESVQLVRPNECVYDVFVSL